MRAGAPLPEVWQHILASSTAGAVNVFATNPLWVAKTRLQIQGFHSGRSQIGDKTTVFKYRGTFHALSSIVRHEGLAGIYSGLSPSLLGVCHIAIQVPLYEELKKIAVCWHGDCGHPKDVTTFDILLSSALAKMVASSVTYPHEVIRSHMHASGRGGFSAFLPIMKQVCFASILRWI
jgi:solute carrier family 25 (mitochondrial folate transporter), member 32